MAILDNNEIFPLKFEPKQVNRFIMYVDDIPSYIIQAADRPKIQIGEVEMPHMNSTWYVAGKPKWQTMSVELYDPIDTSGTQAVMNWIRSCYEAVTGRMGYSDFYKREIRLNALGPAGDIVEEWILKGAWITNPDFGKYDWKSEGLLNITLTIRYDYALLNY
ncbi:MAG TPA: hypothetical protein PLY35_09485 [Thermotogota bacterium]|nr:hypothetical protein [Thermotogota bacterium]